LGKFPSSAGSCLKNLIVACKNKSTIAVKFALNNKNLSSFAPILNAQLKAKNKESLEHEFLADQRVETPSKLLRKGRRTFDQLRSMRKTLQYLPKHDSSRKK
jgi:hypothetical protein